MTAAQIVGAAMVAAVLLGLVGYTAWMVGWREALPAWGFAVVVTVVLMVGMRLLFGGSK